MMYLMFFRQLESGRFQNICRSALVVESPARTGLFRINVAIATCFSVTIVFLSFDVYLAIMDLLDAYVRALAF